MVIVSDSASVSTIQEISVYVLAGPINATITKANLGLTGKIGKAKLVWNKKKKEVKFLVKLKKSNLSSALEIDENSESGSITPDFEIDFKDTNVKASPTINYSKKGTKTKGKL